jgi:hypothetical protein
MFASRHEAHAKVKNTLVFKNSKDRSCCPNDTNPMEILRVGDWFKR